jgi:hypothetical protein
MPRARIFGPAPLDGVVQTDHDRCRGRHEGGDQQVQQPLGRPSGRPSRTVEDAMEGREVAVLIAAEDPQHRRHGAAPWCQDGAREQPQDILPGRPGEQVGEGVEPGQQRRRQRQNRGKGGRRRGLWHPIGRIDSARDHNCRDLRQSESAAPPTLAPQPDPGHTC